MAKEDIPPLEEILKSLMLLFSEVLNEMGTWCHTSTTRDLETVASRVKHEGDSYLTITLPNFATDFQKSLDQGYVDSNQFAGFKRTGGLPRFLGGFLNQVFDRSSGLLLDSPSIDAIFAIRQITLMFGKINRDCTPARTEAALDGYIKCEQSVRDFDKLRTPRMYEEFSKVANLLWSDLFTKVDHEVYYRGVTPKHGPGATADKLTGNRKYDQAEWTSRLEEVFPAAEYLLPGWKHLPSLDHLTWLEPGAERPVRVITVPKTLKTPRIIAIEPTCMQYMQQGLMELFVKGIEGDNYLRHFVGFSDQGPNNVLARKGSHDTDLATLDLSEASDRVSNQLVKALFQNFGTVSRMIDATRSRKADLGSRGIIRLSKFASMGSALCFPMEAMVFLTLIFLGIQDELSKPLTKGDLTSFFGKVRVYGDDIIVPVEYVSSVMRRLETFGFKVNANKSFWTGKFRESCGKDYYDGEDVSVVRVRRDFPSSRHNAQEIVSLISLRNQLYQRGLWQTVKFLDREIERLVPFPAVNFEYVDNTYSSTTAALGKHSFLGFETQRECRRLQKPLVKAAVTRTVIPESKLDNIGALMKFFLKRGDEPHVDPKHLERYGRPDTVGIKIRWAYAH